MHLPELTPTSAGTYATEVGDWQVEVMGPHQIDINLDDGDAIGFGIDAAEKTAYALLAAVRCARSL